MGRRAVTVFGRAAALLFVGITAMTSRMCLQRCSTTLIVVIDATTTQLNRIRRFWLRLGHKKAGRRCLGCCGGIRILVQPL